jgi:hypothetical protein
MCHGAIVQNSCLHGGASISSLLIEGNTMCPHFETPNAVLGHDKEGNTIYEYGACTVPQLLMGRDDRIYDPAMCNQRKLIPTRPIPVAKTEPIWNAILRHLTIIAP